MADATAYRRDDCDAGTIWDAVVKLAKLLVDREATRRKVIAELRKSRTNSVDDVVDRCTGLENELEAIASSQLTGARKKENPNVHVGDLSELTTPKEDTAH